ncbi:type IX secretion system membrane protein PorP/SprF [Fulvivirgaceae bacterium BMA10]|uniref:Type IX secretion system membrane protein PorP/SprF n=2 Tax=Splendidivirga corallicola TaxID=3051826 RepID=A0ABT8KUU0_9BACT|nr:type IX secretion system membrane protein PorP/SprF [Fulvivirgaceae bacterium BMA10]
MKSFNFLLTIICLCCFYSISKSQYKPSHSLSMLNNYLINPAIAGPEPYMDLKISGRNQWVGIDGSPVTYYVSLDTPLNFVENDRNPQAHHAVGGTLLTDKAGPFRRNELNLSYAYHVPITSEITLSAGLSIGALHYNLKTADLNPNDPNDMVIGSGNDNKFSPNLSTGLWLYSDRFQLGISIHQLFIGDTNFGFLPSTNRRSQNINYFLFGSLKLKSITKVSISPVVMIKKIDYSPMAIDIGVTFNYNNRVMAGLTYENFDSVGLLGSFYFSPLLSLGYYYKVLGEGFVQYSRGSHEIVLGLKLKNKPNIVCPKF